MSLFNITLDAGIPTVLAVLSSPWPRSPAQDFNRRRFPESRDRRPVQPGGAGTYPALHAAYYQLAAPVNPVPARSRERGGSGHAPELLVRSRQRPPGQLPGHRRSGLTSGRSRICQPATPWPTEGPVREGFGPSTTGSCWWTSPAPTCTAGPVGGAHRHPGLPPAVHGLQDPGIGRKRLWEVPPAPGLCGYRVPIPVTTRPPILIRRKGTGT